MTTASELTVQESQASPVWLAALRARVKGDVFVPGVEGYEQARQVWNRSFQHQPAVIVLAENAFDVEAAVQAATTAGLRLVVQATGHGAARLADAGAMLLSLERMTGVRVDVQRRTAVIEGGTKWGEVLRQAQQVGLAPLLGSSPDVGAVGYTLGGGMGWLARKYGMSCDSVNWFDVVTAGGQLVRASETENPDLFWALRGGGGSFGVVTAMEVRLYPVTMVYGGNLFYPAALAKDVLARFREWVKGNPDELTSSVAIMNFPPIPDVPEPMRGQTFVMVRGLYAGDSKDGAARIREWLDWQQPIMNTWAEMPFSLVKEISAEPEDPMPAFATGAWVRELSDEAIDTIVSRAVSVNGSSPLNVTEFRHAGGAIARVAPEAAAYGNRDGKFLMQIVTVTPTPEAWAAVRDYAEQFRAELKPALTGKVYMNFTEGDERRERTRDGFSEANFARLQALKARYDAANRFDHAFDIPPAARESEAVAE